MPGLSPSRPALNEPSMLTSSGFIGRSPSKVSNVAVSSPQYQTVPSFACANQSLVPSLMTPSSETFVAHDDAAHVVDQLGPVQYLHDVRFLCAAVLPATADRKREIGVGIRQVAEVGVEIGLLELRIVAAFADLLAQRVACFELRCAFFSCFVEAVLDVGDALGPVATIGFVDADADTDPVVIGRLVGASARYRQRGSRAELTLCEELVDGGRGSRSEGMRPQVRQQEIHGTHAILLRRNEPRYRVGRRSSPESFGAARTV